MKNTKQCTKWLKIVELQKPLFCSLESLPRFKELIMVYYPNYYDTGIKLQDLISFLNSGEGQVNESMDSYYEPLQPDMLIKFRVIKSLEFYKSRIPSYSRTRNIAQTFIVSGSIGTGLVAFFQQTKYAVLISIVISSVTAYLEFHGTNIKISRYPSISHALQNLII
jgi:hypothetical protein